MNDVVATRLSAAAREIAHKQSQDLISEVTGVAAVIVATVDGFAVASAVHKAVDTERLAALASSIAAIGDVVSGEARLGRPRNITVNTDAGLAVVHSVARADLGLVILVVCEVDAVLALVNYRTAQVGRMLEAA